nr:type 1 glutamine amidotransferase [Lysinibacillus timonensis]
MKTYIIQHVAFETPGILESLSNYEVIKMYEKYTFPKIEEVEMLIILGGPMGAYDPFDWLQEEKIFIKGVIAQNKPVLGICLGAQLIAEVIGGEVMSNRAGKEVGWWPIQITSKNTPFDFLPKQLEVLHWHGDTFTLPEDTITFYSTEICEHQAFLYKNNVIGLQFHLEATTETLMDLVAADEDYLDGGEYVQSKEEILAKSPPIENKTILLKLISAIKGHHNRLN